jgi:hypothetical protein
MPQVVTWHLEGDDSQVNTEEYDDPTEAEQRVEDLIRQHPTNLVIDNKTCPFGEDDTEVVLRALYWVLEQDAAKAHFSATELTDIERIAESL